MNGKRQASGRIVKAWLGWLGLSALSLAGVACAGDGTAPAPVPAPVPASSPVTAQGLPAITAAIGLAACDTPAQCRSIGIGAKACGGPESYRAWSVKGVDERALRAAVAAHAAARQAENLRSDMRSTCALEPDPGATCQAARCVLNPRGLGGSSLAQ